jgi:hypothetical protein
MNGTNKRVIERRVDGWFRTCQWIMLQALLFGCFAYDVYRFIHWLWIGSPR